MASCCLQEEKMACFLFRICQIELLPLSFPLIMLMWLRSVTPGLLLVRNAREGAPNGTGSRTKNSEQANANGSEAMERKQMPELPAAARHKRFSNCGPIGLRNCSASVMQRNCKEVPSCGRRYHPTPLRIQERLAVFCWCACVL
jgi:hypothetical protein